jgi:hypothetical protein
MYNETAHEWQWSTNGKSFASSGLPGQLLSEDNQPRKKCVLSNPRSQYYFVPRYCASYGYRFICKRTLSLPV